MSTTESKALAQKNTRKHWAIYALAAWEDKHGREDGATAGELYEFVGGEESRIFKSMADTGAGLRAAHDGDYAERRTVDGEWDGPELIAYRLVKKGAEALRDTGKPDKLPNRKKEGYDRELPTEPTYEPKGGLLSEVEENPDDDWLRTENPDEWEPTARENVFFRDESDAKESVVQRSGGSVEEAACHIGEAYHEWTIVVTRGPYRMHDVMYRADPESKRIHLDYYSIRPGTDHTEAVIQDITRSLKK